MCALKNGLALMALFVHRFVLHWRETQVMAASSKKGDVLFAVGALSDGLFDRDEDVRNYTQVIEDYFADSEMEGETDNECG